MKDLVRRLPTTAVLSIVAYVTIRFLPPLYFALALFAVVSIGAWELVSLTSPRARSLLIVWLDGLLIFLPFAFPNIELTLVLSLVVISTGIFFLMTVRRREMLETFVRDMGIHFLTSFYLYFPLAFMLRLKKIGPNYLFFLILVIAVGDSGAYFLGSTIGRNKIYPVASPKKSLEGLVAAIFFAALAGYLALLIFPVTAKPLSAMASGAVIGLVSQLSDPVESLFKRAAKRKDSGILLPGHGGILDRFDSYIFCAPVLYFIVIYLWQ